MSVNSDNVLLALEKGELVKIIHNLKMEIEKKTEDFSKLINLRLYTLERSHSCICSIQEGRVLK